MHENLSLFADVETGWKQQLAAKLQELARSGLYLGSSSWKFEGWLGSVYRAERYVSRGRFARTRFERECLQEYAEVFRSVSGDFAFYQFPSSAMWEKLFAQVPAGFRFAFKAPEEITTPAFPKHPRYGARAGQTNALFLDARAFMEQFLTPLAPFAKNVAAIVFEFPAALASAFEDNARLAETLERFFAGLPRGFRYATEVRSRRVLDVEYFHVLRNQGVAHVFNSWTDMPSLAEQMADADAFTANFAVSRALVIPGRTYEDSVTRFAPYSAVQEPNAEVRNALRLLLMRGRERGEEIYVYINNRLEGFAPGTIEAIVNLLQ